LEIMKTSQGRTTFFEPKLFLFSNSLLFIKRSPCNYFSLILVTNHFGLENVKRAETKRSFSELMFEEVENFVFWILNLMKATFSCANEEMVLKAFLIFSSTKNYRVYIHHTFLLVSVFNLALNKIAKVWK
jgi:hypothetical protein